MNEAVPERSATDAAPEGRSTRSAATRSPNCSECGGVVLGLDRCDGCGATMHFECGRYRVDGARMLCYACDESEDDAFEPIFDEESPDEQA